MNISVTLTQAQQDLDVMGTFTPEQRIRSSTRRELYGTVKLLQNFGPILNGDTVLMYVVNHTTDTGSNQRLSRPKVKAD